MEQYLLILLKNSTDWLGVAVDKRCEADKG